jgi:hypothetical protein
VADVTAAANAHAYQIKRERAHGASGLYLPPDVKLGERLPLMVMLHGCGQGANTFAASMNRIAMCERLLVLYPSRNAWPVPRAAGIGLTRPSGRAQGEAALIMKAIGRLLASVSMRRLEAEGVQSRRRSDNDCAVSVRTHASPLDLGWHVDGVYGSEHKAMVRLPSSFRNHASRLFDQGRAAPRCHAR